MRVVFVDGEGSSGGAVVNLVPASVMRAITGRPLCDLCGDPILTDGRTRHVICALLDEEDKS